MPLDYNVVEEYHVRLDRDGSTVEGRLWLRADEEWEAEPGEDQPRLRAEVQGMVMNPLPLFTRLSERLAEQQTRLRTCGSCELFRRSPVEEGEGWLGYCGYLGEQEGRTLGGEVSLLAPDCQHFVFGGVEHPVLSFSEIADAGRPKDSFETRAFPAQVTEEKKGFFGKLKSALGLEAEKQEVVRAGVVERPGGQPCPVCGTRMTNRASVANADERGEERVLSVWRCPHCAGNYLDDWFEAYVGSRAHDAERLYVVPPVEADEAAEIVVHCPRPDVKGCTCIANQHFDRWGNRLADEGRRIKARESVVSL